ncbi:MAG: BamA/TamA family outer membrane protein [Pseudomonadota bacterium]
MGRKSILLAIGFAGFLSAHAAVALDSFAISAPGAPEDLIAAFEAASLSKRQVDDDAATVTDLVAAARSDYSNLLGVAYRNGYYSTAISIRIDGREAADISLLDPPRRASAVVVRIDPGPLFAFGRAEIRPLPEGTDLPAGFATGQPAKSTVITEAANAAVEEFEKNSFAKAQIADERVVAYHPEARLDVTLIIDPGPPLKFGNLEIVGNTDIRTERVAAIAGFPSGDWIEPQEVDNIRDRVARSGAFRSIVLQEAPEPNPDGTLNYILTVGEEKKRRFGFGGEWETDEGATVSAFWMHRNVFGGAERLRFDAEISNIGGSDSSNTVGVESGVDYELRALFSRPATIDSKTRLDIGARYLWEDDEDFLLELREVGFGFVRDLSRISEAGVGLAYQLVDLDLRPGRETYELLSLPTYIQRDARVELITDPESGTFARAEFQPWLGLDDTDSGARLYFDLRKYVPVLEDDRGILAGRLQLGSLFGPDTIDIQPDFWYYSGGSGTVRGQPFEILGVEFDGTLSGQIGGSSLAVVNLEYRHRLNDSLGLVGFFDVGAVGPNEFIDSDARWHAGWGFGVRYATPIGPVRADLGFPIDGDAPAPDEDFQLYIGIGQAF